MAFTSDPTGRVAKVVPEQAVQSSESPVVAQRVEPTQPAVPAETVKPKEDIQSYFKQDAVCLLYTSPSPRDRG